MIDLNKIASHVDKARQVATDVREKADQVREKAEQAVDGARASVTHGGVDNISRDQIDALTAELADANAEKGRLYDRIYDLESDKRALQKSKDEEIADLRDRLASRDERITHLKAELSVLTTKHDRLLAEQDRAAATSAYGEPNFEQDYFGNYDFEGYKAEQKPVLATSNDRVPPVEMPRFGNYDLNGYKAKQEPVASAVSDDTLVQAPTFPEGESVEVALTATEERVLFFASTKWLMGASSFSKPSNSTNVIQKLVDKGLVNQDGDVYSLTAQGLQAARMRLVG